MSMAVKYAMKKKGKKDCYADGGDVEESPSPSPKPNSAVQAFLKSFKGSFPSSEDEAQADPAKKAHGGDVVETIMHKRYSKGGQVANDTPPIADSMDAEYDDLVLDDDLEEHETGANSGDELGNAEKDEDEKDLISAIMKSRRKKDKLPNPR